MTTSPATAATVSQDALDAPYPLSAEHKVRFREDGFIRLPGVFYPYTLAAFEQDRLTKFPNGGLCWIQFSLLVELAS